MALSGAASQAATYNVPGDYATIQAAINSAPDGSTILVANGTYTEELRCLSVNRNLYIKSVNGSASTILDGGGTRTLLYVINDAYGDPFKNVTFDGFTFTRGRGQADTSPVTIADTRPNFINCRFVNNTAPVKAGAVLAYGAAAHPQFVGCAFISNRTDRIAGAALINGGHCQATFKDCVFEYNSNRTPLGLNDNVGGCVYFSMAGGRIIGCRFKGNSAAYAGGAIVALNFFTESVTDVVEVKGCVFDNNFCQAIPSVPPLGAPTESGAIHAENLVHVIVSGCYFTNNWAEAAGAIGSYRGDLTLRDCVFENNRATGTGGMGSGGAIGMNNNDAGDADRREAVLRMDNVLIRNSVSPAAGALAVQGDVDASHRKQGYVYLKNVVIDDCTATVAGSSPGHGGGFFLTLANCRATNFYILRNRAMGFGGAGVVADGTQLYLYDSYIVGNNADVTDDAIHYALGGASSSVQYNNTPLAYNGGGPSDDDAFLAAIPPISIRDQGWLTYYVAPYEGSPEIWPSVGGLADDGDFAAGAVSATGVVEDARFRLYSNHPTQTADVTYVMGGVTNPAFPGAPTSLPGRVQAENYNRGGDGVGYHDLDAANFGGTYRTTEGVDISAGGGASGYMVGWIQAGEWLEYTVSSTTSWLMQVNVRLASVSSDGRFYVQVDGTNLGGTVVVPNTGGWTSWATTNLGSISLSPGWHTVRFVVVHEGFNLDYIDFAPAVPTLSVSPLSLYSTVKVGTNASSQTFQVWNSGPGGVDYVIDTNVEWLSTSTSAGTSSGEVDTIRVYFSTAGMATGEYRGSVTVTAAGVAGSPQTVDVTLLVRPNAYVHNDFDGDARADLGVYYPPGGNWYIYRSSRGFYQTAFGYDGTVPITGDFDGDGRADFGCYDDVTGGWYMFNSTEGFTNTMFGFPGTIPITGGFDRDERWDFGCYYDVTGAWYIFKSRAGYYETAFGYIGTVPISGDFDGDGLYDFGCYDDVTGNWYMFKSLQGFTNTAFGFPGTWPVTGDFDGDGRCDFGCYYDITGGWYLFRSRLGYYETQFGFPGTLPITGDFDGDGRCDFGVYNPPDGKWYVFRSKRGFYEDQFGYDGTIPIGGSVR